MVTRGEMIGRWSYILALGFLLTGATAVRAEVEIREAIFLSPENRQKCARLCEINAQARDAFQKIEQEAAGVLGDAPRPIEVIHYEGMLETDRRRKKTEDHLRDMDKLALVTMAYSGNPVRKYEDFIKEYVWAWATTYRPTGNPINENKLEAVYCGYYLVKSAFTEQERTTIEDWLLGIVAKERKEQSTNNWETKRFKIIGEISLGTDRRDLMDVAVKRYKEYMPLSIHGDGSTNDFKKRDALAYHRGGLRPLLVFCLIAEQMEIRVDGKSLYEWEAANGGSVKKAVHFLDPYVLGEKEHMEFQNSTVAFDRQRCKAGVEHYCPHPFDPKDPDNTGIYELASGFEPDLSEMTALVLGSDSTEYPSWLTVMAKSTAISLDRVGTNRQLENFGVASGRQTAGAFIGTAHSAGVKTAGAGPVSVFDLRGACVPVPYAARGSASAQAHALPSGVYIMRGRN